MITILIGLCTLIAWVSYTYYLYKKKANAVHDKLSIFHARLIGVVNSAEALALYQELETYGEVHCQYIFFDVLPRHMQLMQSVARRYQCLRQREQEQLARVCK